MTPASVDFSWSQPSASTGGVYAPIQPILVILSYILIGVYEFGSGFVDSCISYIPEISASGLRLSFDIGGAGGDCRIKVDVYHNGGLFSREFDIVTSFPPRRYDFVLEPDWELGGEARVVVSIENMTESSVAPVIACGLLLGDMSFLGLEGVTSRTSSFATRMLEGVDNFG